MRPSEYTTTLSDQQLSSLGWFNRRALNLLHKTLDGQIKGRLTLELPNGMIHEFGQQTDTEHHAIIKINSFKSLRRLVRGGSIGFAESFMDGEWQTPDEVSVIRWALANENLVNDILKGHPLLRLFNRLSHLGRANTKKGSRKNISYHYDLGNDFYEQWLDPTFTYSSALFNGQESLEEAQLNKYRTICQMLDLKAGEHVLEIGCGWGGFAEIATNEFGAKVTGITLSKEQLAFAKDRMARLNLADKADLQLIDYRDVQGEYDHIVSIEMFEAVGEEHWPTYFETLKKRLKQGGSAVLQIISIADDRFEQYRSSADFIQRYIFPGGMLPSPTALQGEILLADLKLCEQKLFGLDYAKTLEIWRRNFLNAWPTIKATEAFDERFRRMWVYYLAYCEGGFREGSIDVGLYKIQH